MPFYWKPQNEAIFRYYRRLKKLKLYMDKNPGEHITLAKAADIVGLSEKYFSTYFHNRTGILFRDWIAQICVDRAANIIRSENHSISEIAFMVGFDNIRSFERAFKTHKGMTPSEYKKSVRPKVYRNI